MNLDMTLKKLLPKVVLKEPHPIQNSKGLFNSMYQLFNDPNCFSPY